MSLHWQIIGIRIFGNSVVHIQRTITLLISIENIQNLCSYSNSECVLSKTFRPLQEIPYRSKVIVETVTEGHFSTHFISNYISSKTSQKCIFLPKFYVEAIDHAIWEKYFQSKLVCESLDYNFYVPPSA